MKSKSIKKNIIYNTFYQVLTLILPFITAPYISRVIGVEGIGRYSYTTSIQLYFSMFIALGTTTYGIREIARNRDDKYKRSKLFFEIELLTVVTTFICLIFWVGLIVISNENRIFYLILTLNLLNTMFDISWFYSGIEEFKYTIIQNTIFKVLGVISLFIFIKGPEDLMKYVLIMSLSTLLGTLSMWIYLPKFISKIKISDLKIWPHFKETLVYFIPTIATSVYSVLDKTLIGVITKDVSENGYYEQATKIINMAKAIVFTSINTVLGSRISYLFAEKKYEEIKMKIRTSINYILIIGIGICFGLIVISDKFIPIFFGDGYEKSSILIKLLSPLVVIIGISNCLGSQYYTPVGKRKFSAKIIILGAVINFILNLILIPKFNSIGAVISTIVAEIVITYLYIRNCNDFCTFKLIINLSWKKILAGIIMFIAIYPINFMNLNDIIIIISQVLIGICVYFTIIYILKDESVKELKNMLKIKK